MWLLTDMALNIWALTIVKALGLGYPASQIVFLRATVGLVLVLPWAWHTRGDFRHLDRLHLHGLRVLFSTLALATGFFAIARLPFALFTTISFMRPVVMMVMALIFLGEIVPRYRWAAATLAFIGVLIAIQPGKMLVSWGLPAIFLAVIFGTSAIILTRMLAGTPTVVMMVFYTAGLSVLTAPVALLSWTPVAQDHLFPLLAIGVFSQSAQFCFLQAHARAEAGFLAVFGYLSLILTTGVGYFVFNEVPTLTFGLGAGFIVASTLWITLAERQLPSGK